MKKHLFFPFFLLFFFSCNVAEHGAHHKKPVVLVSIAPYKTLVEKLLGNIATVEVAIPPGVDPHNWEPTIKDMHRLHQTKIWIQASEEFEPALLRSFQSQKVTPYIISLEKILPSEMLLETKDGNTDSHFWLSPTIDLVIAQKLSRVFEQSFPEKKDVIAQREKLLRKSLQNLKNTVHKHLTPISGYGVITTHNAFRYLFHPYNIFEIEIEPGSGKDPRAKDLDQTLKKIRDLRHKIILAIIEPAHSNRPVKSIAQKFSFPLTSIDPYDEDYEKTIENICFVMTESLKDKQNDE